MALPQQTEGDYKYDMNTGSKEASRTLIFEGNCSESLKMKVEKEYTWYIISTTYSTAGTGWIEQARFVNFWDLVDYLAKNRE